MMFIVRTDDTAPTASAIAVKASRRTPASVSGGPARTDYFCVGETEAAAALRGAGWEVVDLYDGWYAGDNGGGVAISGHGRYWEIRDTLFTVKEAAGPGGAAAPAASAAAPVNVRCAIFGV